MLNKLRNFSKGKVATVMVAIIAVPFVFWGMGSVFSSGNTNSVVKINSFNISTEKFVNYINESNIKTEIIKNNIDENILEDLLTELVSNTLIDMEISDNNIRISDKVLAKRIRKNKSFQDENNNFSRIKYEKFLLENNISAAEFEIKLRNKEQKNNFFAYISGGVKSPYFFTNNIYKNQKKKVEISYINLNLIYKKKNQFTSFEIDQFINDNKEKLKKEFIDFSFVKITPNNLIQGSKFNEDFFSKIDEIENLITNNISIENIASNYSLKLEFVKNYINEKNDNELYKEIYLDRNKNKIQLIDKNDYFLLYQIDQIEKILPNIKDVDFLNLVKNTLYEKNKYDYNKQLILNIQKNNFTDNEFLNLVNDKNLINKIKIQSIKDNKKFTENSIKLLYAMPKSSFLLLDDKENNIYITKIENIISDNLNKNSNELNNFAKQSKINLRDKLYSSYDYLMNEKYKIKINQKTLERVKNYFR